MSLNRNQGPSHIPFQVALLSWPRWLVGFWHSYQPRGGRTWGCPNSTCCLLSLPCFSSPSCWAGCPRVCSSFTALAGTGWSRCPDLTSFGALPRSSLRCSAHMASCLLLTLFLPPEHPFPPPSRHDLQGWAFSNPSHKVSSPVSEMPSLRPCFWCSALFLCSLLLFLLILSVRHTADFL